MLVLEGLYLRLPELIIDIPLLEVKKGNFFVLLGPVGSGKSSLLQVLAGFLQPERGRVHLDGVSLLERPAEERSISILFQNARLFPHLNVRENICYACRNPASLDHLVELLGLSELLDRAIHKLSGGERQLVALARALMVRPRVLLLDEPFSSLDPRKRRSASEVLLRVQREMQLTTLLVTHRFEEALELGGQLGILLGGRLEQVGPPEEVFAHPATPEVARFLGSENLFRGRFTPLPGQSGSPPGSPFLAHFEAGSTSLVVLTRHLGPGHAMVQPQDITLSLEPVSSSALNRFEGRVESISSQGPLVELQVRAGLLFKVFITPQSRQALALEEGSRVFLSFKASAVKTY